MDLFNTLSYIIRPYQYQPKTDVFLLTMPFKEFPIGTIAWAQNPGDKEILYWNMTTERANGLMSWERDIPGTILQPASTGLHNEIHEYLNSKKQ